ncbi:MAG: hypothetical protein ABIQ44_14020, partial [Chloroflexia bacterium]
MNEMQSSEVQEQIKVYITSQAEPKRSDMQDLHRVILEVMPGCKLWFLDGKNSENIPAPELASSSTRATATMSAGSSALGRSKMSGPFSSAASVA